VKDETANLIAEELDKTFEYFDISIVTVLELMIGSKLRPSLRQTAKRAHKAGWRSMLKTRPEPSKEQLAEILAIIGSFRAAPHKMRNLLKQRVKEIPHAPGGPRRKIKPEEERKVCAEIIQLRAECDTREAIRRVAQRYRVSDRTVYRIWGKYHPKKKTSRRSKRLA
jgi:hypothetical protein